MADETEASPVRSAREHAGLSREQLAVKAGLSGTTVYLAERAGLISEVTAKKLSAVLGVPAKALLARTEDAKPEGAR